MPSRPFPEILLALFAGRTRAAAIYGDLTEMAATRGRGWFAAAYLRMLTMLGWRTPVAFVCGLAAVELVTRLIEFWLAHMPGAWSYGFLPALYRTGLLVFAITGTLVFFAPYTAVRYGLRDRVVRLACVVLLLNGLACLLPPSFSPVSESLAAAVLLTALCLKSWRRPAAVLLVSVAVGTAFLMLLLPIVVLGIAYLQEQFPNPPIRYKQAVPWDTIIFLTMLAVAAVCNRMRRRLMPVMSIDGAAHA